MFRRQRPPSNDTHPSIFLSADQLNIRDARAVSRVHDELPSVVDGVLSEGTGFASRRRYEPASVVPEVVRRIGVRPDVLLYGVSIFGTRAREGGHVERKEELEC